MAHDLARQPKTILVTGAAGFIGSHLCDGLLQRGHKVIGLDNFASGKRENIEDALTSPRFEFVEGSVLDAALMSKLCAQADEVYHLAVECVRASIGRPLQNHEINATGTLVALEAARTNNVQKFLYCSSSEIYGNGRDKVLSEDRTVPEPVTVYGGAKLVGEYYTKAYFHTYGMQTVIVRPFNSYGPREHYEGILAEVIPKFIIRVLNNLPPLIYGSGENCRDFTYVLDTVRGIIAAAECQSLTGQVVNIAFGKPISVAEVAQAIIKVSGKSGITPTHLEERPGDVLHLHADTTLAQKHLQFKAEISFEEGVRKTVEWFQAKFPDPSVLLKVDMERAWAEVAR